MSKRLAVLIAAAIVPALTFAAPAHARTQYPYRLTDLGTFGGPSSYLQLPAIPITSNGTVLGLADTPARDRDWPHCFACQDPFIQHAFAWNDGRLTDLGALPGNNSSKSPSSTATVSVSASRKTGAPTRTPASRPPSPSCSRTGK